MVKHTQTIRRQQPTNCLSVFDHFVGLAFKGLKDKQKFQNNFVETKNHSNIRELSTNLLLSSLSPYLSQSCIYEEMP